MSQLTTTESNTSLVPTANSGGPAFNPTDVILPSIGLRQNSFKKDEYKKMPPGSIILKPDLKIIGDEDKPFLFVPVSIERVTRLVEVNNSDTRFVRFEPVNPDAPGEFTEGGRNFRRDRTFITYIIGLETLKAQAKASSTGELDPDALALPTRLSFSRGSFYAGKVLNTHFEMCKMLGATPTMSVFSLKSVAKQNDKGHWFVFDIAKAMDAKGVALKTPKEVLNICKFWGDALSKHRAQMKHTPDDDDDVVEASQPIDETIQTF